MSHLINERSLFSTGFGHGILTVQSLVVMNFICLVACLVNMYRINVRPDKCQRCDKVDRILRVGNLGKVELGLRERVCEAG